MIWVILTTTVGTPSWKIWRWHRLDISCIDVYNKIIVYRSFIDHCPIVTKWFQVICTTKWQAFKFFSGT